jgi:hypothetical protein
MTKVNIERKNWLKDNQVMIDGKFYKMMTIREDGQKILVPEAATDSVIKEWKEHPESKPPTYVQNPDGTVLPLLSGREVVLAAMQSSISEPRITPKLSNLQRVTRLTKGDVVAANIQPYMSVNARMFDPDYMSGNQNSYFKVIESDDLYAVYDPKYATFSELNDTAVAKDLHGADILTYDGILKMYPEMTTNTEALKDMKYGETCVINTNSAEYDIVLQNAFMDDFAVSSTKGADTVPFGGAVIFNGKLPISEKGLPDLALDPIKCAKLSSIQHSDLIGCTVGAPDITFDSILHKPVYQFDLQGFKNWINNLDFEKEDTYNDFAYRMYDKSSFGMIYIPEEYQHGLYVNMLGGSYDVDAFQEYKADPSKYRMSLVLSQTKDGFTYMGLTDRFDHVITGEFEHTGWDIPDVSNVDLKKVVMNSFTPSRRQLIYESEKQDVQNSTQMCVESPNAAMFK